LVTDRKIIGFDRCSSHIEQRNLASNRFGIPNSMDRTQQKHLKRMVGALGRFAVSRLPLGIGNRWSIGGYSVKIPWFCFL
jgi:hypothetical protein